MKKTLLLLILNSSFLLLNAQWTTVATDNFDNYPTGFIALGFNHVTGGAEVGGATDYCAYIKVLGTGLTQYLSKEFQLEGGYIYRYSYRMKKRGNACGVTFKYNHSVGTGGIVVSSEYAPPQRLDSEAGDQFFSNEITGNGQTYYLKAVVTTGGPTGTSNNRLRIDGFILERKPVVLPITLQSFSVKENSLAQVELKWTTASEFNNHFIAVERSSDGKQYNEIGRLSGKGSTTDSQHYTFLDKQPNQGVNYYRLRQEDYNGEYQYHQTKSVFIKTKQNRIQIRPTVSREQIKIFFTEAFQSNASVKIFNIDGRLCRSEAYTLGVLEMELNISDLLCGQYIVQVTDGVTISTAMFNKL